MALTKRQLEDIKRNTLPLLKPAMERGVPVNHWRRIKTIVKSCRTREEATNQLAAYVAVHHKNVKYIKR